MTNDQRHFISNLRRSPVPEVNRVNGSTTIKGAGTIKLRIEDNNGKPHTFIIPSSLYVPRLTNAILSPQHWASSIDKPSNKITKWKTQTEEQQLSTGMGEGQNEQYH